MKNFINGFMLPLRGAHLLLTVRGVKRWAIAPLIISAFFYVLVFALLVWLLPSWQLVDLQWNFWDEWGAKISSGLNTLSWLVQWLLFFAGFWLLSYFTFTFFVELLASPFNDILSEKLEVSLTQKTFGAVNLRLNGKAIYWSLCSTFYFLSRQFFWLIATLPLLFIPLIGTMAWFLLNAYFVGVTFFDVAMARNFLTYRHKMAAIRENRAVVIGFGSALSLLFLMPFIGWLIIPFGVAGGTILYCQLDWHNIFKRANLPPPANFSL